MSPFMYQELVEVKRQQRLAEAAVARIVAPARTGDRRGVGRRSVVGGTWRRRARRVLPAT